MTRRAAVAWRRGLAMGFCVVLTITGCTFRGVNSLPLPGAVGRGPGAVTYHVEIANVAQLEPNSPVMIRDVVVGSVTKIRAKNWHADVEISVRRGTAVPANVVAAIGQTSLLGSMHLELNPPLGQPPGEGLHPGSTIPLNQSSTYPTTERTLSSLAAVVNGGALGQIGDVIHSFSAALSGRQDRVRDLLTRLDKFVGTLDDQRTDIIESISELNRLSGTFAAQRDVIVRVLGKVPPALDVLIRERPRFITALKKLHVFSDTATQLVNDAGGDLVKNLQNLEPTIRALADVGSNLDAALAEATTWPYTQGAIDREVRGDYMNLFAVLDITIPRLKRTLVLGTRWGQEGAMLTPAPGDPAYLNYTYDPLSAGLSPPPADAPPAPPQPGPAEVTPQPMPSAAPSPSVNTSAPAPMSTGPDGHPATGGP